MEGAHLSPHAALVAVRESRVERRRADAAARNPADREEIGAEAVRAEVLLDLFENRRRPIGGSDAAAGRRDDHHRHAVALVHFPVVGLRESGLSLRIPGFCRSLDVRSVIGAMGIGGGRFRRTAVSAVAKTHPMKRM